MLVWLYQFFPSILNAIFIVKPETVIRWHRRGFRAYWRRKSRQRDGRPRIDGEIRDLIQRMSRDNPLWGAPRIHAELLMLGIEVAKSTVGRYLPKRRQPPSQGWRTSERCRSDRSIAQRLKSGNQAQIPPSPCCHFIKLGTG